MADQAQRAPRYHAAQLRQRPLSNPSDFHHFLVNHQRPPAADVELQVEMQEALVSLVGIKLDLAEAVP
jgi:hypothetical protein